MLSQRLFLFFNVYVGTSQTANVKYLGCKQNIFYFFDKSLTHTLAHVRSK